MTYGYEELSKLLCKEAKNERTTIESGVYCFDQAIEQKPEGDKLNYEMYLGRAKFNMFLRNFGYVKEDCLEAQKFMNTTAIYIILARSRLMLEKYDEALKHANQGLKDFPENEKLLELRNKAQEECTKEQSRLEEISTLKQHETEKKILVYRALRERGIKLGKRQHHLPEVIDQQIFLDDAGMLHYPVLILYDEYMTTDFVQDFREDQTLRSQLELVLADRPPWDEEGKYTINNVEVYFEADQTTCLDPKEKPTSTHSDKYIEIKMGKTLGEALQHKHHIVPQYPVLKIVPKNSAFREAFLDE